MHELYIKLTNSARLARVSTGACARVSVEHWLTCGTIETGLAHAEVDYCASVEYDFRHFLLCPPPPHPLSIPLTPLPSQPLNELTCCLSQV